MVRVRPGVELTCASFCPSRELIRLDLPTFDRPRKANSGGPSAGNSRASPAAIRNLAWSFFIFLYPDPAGREREPYNDDGSSGSPAPAIVISSKGVSQMARTMA